MELIKELTEKDLGLSEEGVDFDMNYKIRKAARAVVVDDQDRLALLFDTRHNHHKIPGGGVDKGETIIEALRREVKEEVGCEIEIIDELGIFIEYRNQLKILQISYCWLAKVKGEIGEPQFDEEEVRDGFKLKWATINKALKLFENDKPREYTGPFMRFRDWEFLKKAVKSLT